MNIAALTVLNYIDICVATICNVIIIIYIFHECRRKKKLYFLSLHAKELFPLFFLLHGIGIIIFNIMKLTSELKDTIGHSTGITIVASLLPVFLFTGLVLYYSLIFSFLKGYSRIMSPASSQKVKSRFACLSYFSYFIPPFSVAVCLIQSIGLLYPNHEESFGQFYNICTSLSFFAFSISSINAIGFIIRELDDYIKGSKTCVKDIEAVRVKLKNAYLTLWIVLFPNFILFMSFGSNMYLLRRSSYMILVIQIMMSPTLLVLIMTVVSTSQGSQRVYVSSEKTFDSKSVPQISLLRRVSDISRSRRVSMLQQADINGQNDMFRESLKIGNALPHLHVSDKSQGVSMPQQDDNKGQNDMPEEVTEKRKRTSLVQIT
jgi:hypothetical protein